MRCAGTDHGTLGHVSSATRILIVDDDRSIRRTLEKFLAGEGYEVTTAIDAPSAIAAVSGGSGVIDRARPAAAAAAATTTATAAAATAAAAAAATTTATAAATA